MVLKTTTRNMEKLLQLLMIDLEKSDRNKTAAQRVRTNSVKFQKLAKVYRRESMDLIKGVTKKKSKKKAAPKSKVVKARKNVGAKSKASARRSRSRA